jgi:hypothetical protein
MKLINNKKNKINFQNDKKTHGEFEAALKYFESTSKIIIDKLPDINNKSIQATRSTKTIIERPIKDKKGKVISM